MQQLQFILNLLNGKKATIFALANAIVVYLLAKQLIDADLATLIASIIVILGGTANFANYKLNK